VDLESVNAASRPNHRPSPDETGRRHRDAAGLAVLAIVLALLPVVAVVVTRSWHHYLPLGDEAAIDLRTRDVFTSHTPLVGAYSRGFDHPGPAVFWLLAPFSALAGGAAWGTLVGAAILQGVAIAASGWLAFRRAGLLLALLVLAGLGLAYSSFALGDQFLQPWNPTIAFPFFMLFLLQAWSLSLGDRWQLLGIAVIGSLLVQFHIGYLPLVAIGVGWAGLLAFFDRRRQGGREAPAPAASPVPWSSVVGTTALALAALWIAPLVQQLTQEPGNLSAIRNYFQHAGNDVAGLRVGAGIFAAEFKVPPPWLGGSDTLAFATSKVATASLWWLLIPAVLLAVGFVAARATGSRPAARMLQLALLTSCGSILAISRVSVELQPFLFYWRVTVAVFVVVATLWAVALWSGLEQHRRARRGALVLLLVVIALFFGARTRDDVLRHTDVLGPFDTYAERLFDQTRTPAHGDATILVRGVGATTNGLAEGLVDDLARHDVQVRVDPRSGFQYGSQRTAKRSDVDQVWFVSLNGSDRALLDRPGATLIASVTPLRRQKESELRRLQAGMLSQLRAAGREDLARFLDSSFFGIIVRDEKPDLDLSQADRIAKLDGEVAHSGGCRCVIVAFPARQAPNIPYSMGF
jgi:hypothetical protein